MVESKHFSSDCDDNDEARMDDDCSPSHGCNFSEFKIGDHIYAWGEAKIYNHHCIVVHVNDDDGGLIVADFSCLVGVQGSETSTSRLSAASFPSSFGRASSFGTYHSSTKFVPSTNKLGALRSIPVDDPRAYRKVKYNATASECCTSRAGTHTTASPSNADTVLARVQFLDENYDLIPPYHLLLSNCETVAFWCMTGTWRTMQVTAALRFVGAGSTAGTGAAAVYFAGQTVTVPAAGIWGWLGYTTEVALTATQPLLLPAIAVGGSILVGTTVARAINVHSKWKETTELLNDAFLQRHVLPTELQQVNHAVL